MPPRAGEKTALHCRAVGKPVPRHRSRARPSSSESPDLDPFVIRRAQTTDGETHIMTMALAGDRPPRYDKKRRLLTVGRGPVPRHRSCPRTPTLAGDRPPRYGKKRPLTVGRGPVPRHRSCPRNPTLAGDRPTRYGKIKTRRALLRYCIEI